MTVVSREFEARADAIGAIRSWVQEALLRHGAPDEAIDTAVLCTSELATNALLHGDGPIGVGVALGARARVSVLDRNRERPELRQAAPDDLHGRGLLLVSTFADDWGVETGDTGKCVWFEIDLRARPQRSAEDHRRRRTDAVDLRQR